MIKIAVLGYGTVGSGVVEVIDKNIDSITRRIGEEIEVKYVLDLRDFPGDRVESILVHDFDVILNDPEVRIVVEVMGGVEPAYTFVKKCLLAGKSVCTSNKELVASHGPELIKIAREGNNNFLFEASVGGAIPVIRPINSSLTADRILEIKGILNGTTNYILTQMSTQGWEFEDALHKAQELGYAERNPEADIEGYDACRKIAILSSLAFGHNVDYTKVHTEGITGITSTDICYAAAMDSAIKLLASSYCEDGRYYAMVAPFVVHSSHPLYAVSGVYNAIFVKGTDIGDVMFYGSGAGKLPTACAVVADVVDAAKHLGRHIYTSWSQEDLTLTGIDDATRSFYVRIAGKREALEDAVRKEFGDVKFISIKEDPDGFAIVTPPVIERSFKEHIANIPGVTSYIRMEGSSAS
ncbi:MAG: homoserine dehydrogenase [Lachnospiraceae bacterium]|nr:homoserine dehydrogenase [Lachnospiraceae bacterium]